MNVFSLLTRFSRDGMTLAAVAVPVLLTLAPATARADDSRAATPAPSAAAAPGVAVAPGAVPPAAPPAAAPIGPPPATIVELEADDNRATIERRVGTEAPTGLPLLESGVVSVGQWQQECVAPCTVKLDPRYSYRVSGDGLVPTDAFALPRNGDRVKVDAKMGSSTGRVAGAVATVGGLAAVAVGGIALIATPILHSQDVGSEGFRTAVLAGGVSALSVGVVAVGIGTFLWLTNGSTARTQVASR